MIWRLVCDQFLGNGVTVATEVDFDAGKVTALIGEHDKI